MANICGGTDDMEDTSTCRCGLGFVRGIMTWWSWVTGNAEAQRNSEAEVKQALFVLAVCGSGLSSIETLLAGGADPNAEISVLANELPLNVAARRGKCFMMKLLEHGADIHGVDRRGTNVLHSACEGPDAAEMAEWLIKQGLNVNTATHFGRTPLHVAVHTNKDQPDTLTISLPEEIMRFPVGGASKEHPTVEVLLNAGAKVDQRDFIGQTPLHYAAINGDPVAALALLKAGSDVNAMDGRKDGPLHNAACHAGRKRTGSDESLYPELVELLVKWGADHESFTNNDGKTAAELVGVSARKFVGYFPEMYWYDETTAERVHDCLARAPSLRAWQRRGLWILSRGYPERVKLSSAQTLEATQANDGTDSEGDGLVTMRVDTAEVEEEWMSLAARVVGIAEDGVFHRILSFL